LRAKAEELAPDLADGQHHRVDGTTPAGGQTAYPDQPGGGGATRR